MKNLLLVSLDTVRADVAYSGRIAPVNEWRKESVTFLNAISSSPLTSVSHATVFTGLQPYNHGIRHLFKERLNDGLPTIASRFKEAGYRTGAIASCPGMNAWYGHNRGFDHYDDEIPRLPDGSDPLETVDVKKRGQALKRAPLVIERAKDWLEQDPGKPFFLFMHFFDAHWPYEAPEKLGGENYYEEEVAYSAHYLDIFFKSLKEKGLWDNTTVICFSDHGEDLDGLYPNDKGGEKLGHPEELGHGCLLYDQTQKVVLTIKDGDLPAGIDLSSQVRLVDIAPTALELMGLPELDKTDGTSLLPWIKGGRTDHLPAYMETFYPLEQTEATGGRFSDTRNKKAVRLDNRSKTIFHLDSDDIEIYDLKGDPNETSNIA